MAKVLRNFKKLNKKFKEFELIKLRADEDVLADLPICLCDYGVDYKEPLVVTGAQGSFPICLEKEEVAKRIKDTRIFNLKKGKEGNLKEVSGSEKAEVSVRLNNDTDLSKLTIENGQLKQKPKEESKE